MKMNAIEQPYITQTRHCQRNQLCDENLDEPETRTTKLITDFARDTGVSQRSICGACKYAYDNSTEFAPQLRTNQRPTLSTEKHTPRLLRGVRVIQRHSRHA